ncbi:MAG: GntR family transcriptional regulator [Spirochaetales bacterium]
MAIPGEIQLLPKDRIKPIHRWVYEVLRLNIVQLHLEPGRFLSETEMAEKLGVSRTPVREAYIRLADEGLLEVLPQRGSVVSLIDLSQAKEARFVRLAVEREVLKEACQTSLLGINELEANLLKQAEFCQSEQFDQLLITDNEFHRILFRLCGKQRVWDSLKRLDYNYDRLRVMTLPLSGKEIIQQHREILKTLRNRTIEKIDALLEQHLTWQVIDQVIFEYPPTYFLDLSSREPTQKGIEYSIAGRR